MIKQIAFSIAFVCAAGTAVAQNTSGSISGSLSTSHSGVLIEGSNVPNNTPSLGNPRGNNTAPCVIDSGFGVVVPGFGINMGGGRLEQECNTRAEMEAIYTLAGREAAIRHACGNDASMARTLSQAGLCPAPAAHAPATAAAPAATVRNTLRRCVREDGVILVRVAPNSTAEERNAAEARCRAQLAD